MYVCMFVCLTVLPKMVNKIEYKKPILPTYSKEQNGPDF